MKEETCYLLPVINYCIVLDIEKGTIIHNNSTDDLIYDVVKLQKKVIRIINDVPRDSYANPRRSRGLHNCLEFSQPLECLYQAMQTQEKSFLLLL